MADDTALQWIVTLVEGVLSRYAEAGEDPSTKTVYIDNPTVSLDEGCEIARRFRGRIKVLLWPNGVPFPCPTSSTTRMKTKPKSSG